MTVLRSEPIYLAGKISKNDWRHRIVPTLRSAEWGKRLPITIDGRPYTGPFFVSDDHGCAHGPAQHGNMDGDGCPLVTRYRPFDVVNLCCRAIKQADIVFAWIDDPACYGTIAEVGYARALGKPVYVGLDTKLIKDVCIANPKHPKHTDYNEAKFDLWFPATMATRYGWFDSVMDAYRVFVVGGV